MALTPHAVWRSLILSLLVAFPLAVDCARAQGDPKPDSNATDEFVRRGVQILLSRQESLDAVSPPNEWPYEGVYRVRDPQGVRRIPIGYRVGGTAICARALLEAPGFERDEERQAAVGRAVTFILDRLEDPKMNSEFVRGYDVRNWGHMYALDFLLRLEATSRAPSTEAARVKKAIPALVAVLEATEIPDAGGWNYSRRGNSPRPSTFMTAVAIQSLCAAKKAGHRVNPEVVARALDSLEKSRLETGAYQYASNPRNQKGTGFEAIPGAIGRMPVCESTLLLAERGDLQRLRGSLDAFFQHWSWLEARRKKTGTHEPPFMVAPYYFFFAHYYAAQAIELIPADQRAPYRARLRRLLVDVREDSGGWNDRVFNRSENFGTAMALLALLAPTTPRPAAWRPPGEGQTREF
jgi:hypothetical protein